MLEKFGLTENELLSAGAVKDYPICNLTSYKTGGNCDYAFFPETEQELRQVLTLIKNKLPYFVLGGGTNVLVSDEGFHGAVICTKKLNRIITKGNLMICECGAPLRNVIKEAYYNSFSGLEFAVGIPATVGGAVAMNAGCFGKSVSDAICYVITEQGVYNKKNCGFIYRGSKFGIDETIIKVCFKFSIGEADEIEENLRTYRLIRKNPSGRTCGSVFKNDGFFAGKIIDECGLKNSVEGGAKVSPQHANFIVAGENCSSQDIYNLIKKIKEKVFSVRGITLSEELKYLGEFK